MTEEELFREVAGQLPGLMLHEQAKGLPPEAQAALESGRGGTLVIWHAGRPLAVLVVLPLAPASHAEIREGFVRLAELFAASWSPKTKPRRKRS